MSNKFSIVSLGCSKNLVDSEQIVYIMMSNNYEMTDYINQSDICIINTCGFIEDAKKESIDTILEVVSYKNKSNLKYIIVTGCLAQRYYKELKEEIPEIDAFLGTTSFSLISNVIEGLKIGKNNSVILDSNFDFDLSMKREQLTEKYYAYLKIAEGCNNRCTYCIIPKLRGNYRSRPIEDIYSEALYLADNGVKELVLIAQDTSKYGSDLYGKNSLDDLLEKLSGIKSLKWIRFLYTYPEDVSVELVEVVKNNDKIVPYFDIPIQHCNNRILKLMNRNITKERLVEKIRLIRDNIPDAVIRTTLMVGFPTETEEEFEELLDFVKEIKFDKLGVFEYSDEENTPAYKLKGKNNEEAKKIRKEKIMKMQQVISKNNNKKYVGNIYDIIIDEIIDSNTAIGRGYMDTIEIDGVVYINNLKSKSVGDFTKVEIIDVTEYDLYGDEI